MNSRFRIELSSDLDYEEMVVYISLDEQVLALLNCEKGLDNLELEIYSLDSETTMLIPYLDYLEAIEFAEKTLVEVYERG